MCGTSPYVKRHHTLGTAEGQKGPFCIGRRSNGVYDLGNHIGKHVRYGDAKSASIPNCFVLFGCDLDLVHCLRPVTCLLFCRVPYARAFLHGAGAWQGHQKTTTGVRLLRACLWLRSRLMLHCGPGARRCAIGPEDMRGHGQCLAPEFWPPVPEEDE